MSENLTQEQINTLLTDLFVNMNNLDKTYYDMFYNPVPMDIVIERYDDNNVLQTYTIPNRAKDRQQGVVLKGTVPPEGQVQAEAGTLYLDTVSLSLYYKASGNATDALGWIELASGSGGVLPVSGGGTGRTSFGNTLLKGNGTNQVLDATEFLDNPTEIQTDITNGNWSADYVNPYSVDGIANNKVSEHNVNNNAHQDLFNSKQNKLQQMGSATQPVYVSANGVVSVCNSYPSALTPPDYSNTSANIGLGNNYVAPQNGYLMCYVSREKNAVGPAFTAQATIGGKVFEIGHFFMESGFMSAWAMFPVAQGTTCKVSITKGTATANYSYVYFIPCL